MKRDFSSLLNRRCKRKDERKQKKKMSKLCRLAFTKHMKVEKLIEEEFKSKDVKTKSQRKRERRRQAKAEKAAAALESNEEENFVDLKTFSNEAEKERRKRLLEDAEDDEGVVVSLEKKLGYDKKPKKKKQKNDPEAFLDEVFYALEDDMKDVMDEENIDEESKSEEDEKEGKTDEEDGEDHLESENSVGESESADEEEEEENEMSDDSSSTLKATGIKNELQQKVFNVIMDKEGGKSIVDQLKELSLHGPDEREIINVSFICALQAEHYDQRFATIIDSFCNMKSQFKVTTQFAIWDRIKEFKDFSSSEKENFSYLVSDLIKMEAVNISVLKIINLPTKNHAHSVLVYKIVFHLLTKNPDYVVRRIFLKLIRSKINRKFGDQLEAFLSVWDVEQCKAYGTPAEFLTFQNQLAAVRRLWAV